ncbi:MAG: hypothetical protein IKE73_03315 [Bacilli bacterium]|nr:hypothetical protein [Bacilli bacterium]
MISYEGIFFEEESEKLLYSLEEVHLPIINDKYHCTFKYHPSNEEIFNELVGKEIEVQLVGYACNGRNSGFLIKLPEYIEKYYINIDNGIKIKSHITTSIEKDAEPYDTKNLDFKPLPKIINIKGKFGYFIKESDKEYISYKPYNNI